LIEELESRTTATPAPLPDDLDRVYELEYRKVAIRGKFDHSKELYIMPRSPVAGSLPEAPTRSQALSEQKQSGANVITAFQVESTMHPNLRILVNRGFVPRDKVNPEKRKQGQTEETIDLVGIVRLTEKRKQFSPANTSNQWFHRDVEAMSRELNTAPIFIDADRKSTIPGGPIGGQTVVTLRNEHLSYIITWYSLSAVTLFMWMKAYWIK
jgi:surfeit locus 1 family protein